MGARKNARERRRHARGEGAPLPRARPFFLAPIYFLAPATQASASISLPASRVWERAFSQASLRSSLESHKDPLPFVTHRDFQGHHRRISQLDNLCKGWKYRTQFFRFQISLRQFLEEFFYFLRLLCDLLCRISSTLVILERNPSNKKINYSQTTLIRTTKGKDQVSIN